MAKLANVRVNSPRERVVRETERKASKVGDGAGGKRAVCKL